MKHAASTDAAALAGDRLCASTGLSTRQRREFSSAGTMREYIAVSPRKPENVCPAEIYPAVRKLIDARISCCSSRLMPARHKSTRGRRSPSGTD